ncbi:WhiB family transcriptional regulator [Nocardia sp. NPDC055165]
MSDIIGATCRTTDPELWWPAAGETVGPKRAKQVCAECPVRVACGKLARDGKERFGIWAGFNMPIAREREALHDWLNSVELAESVSA